MLCSRISLLSFISLFLFVSTVQPMILVGKPTENASTPPSPLDENESSRDDILKYVVPKKFFEERLRVTQEPLPADEPLVDSAEDSEVFDDELVPFPQSFAQISTELEKRDPEEQGYPQDLPGDLIRILPKLPRTDRKPRFNLELLLSARNQILPFI